MLAEGAGRDLDSPGDVAHMIQYSVRWAVPFIYLVVAASASFVLFPGPASRWCLRNRRYLGLVFAVAMAWQATFIFLISSSHADYYYDEVYFLRDELEGSSGYLFLAAMVVTSFRFGRRHLSQAQWKTLHRSGMYFLWAYPFSVYWWNLFYYDNPLTLDYLFYSAGFAAVALRIAAWGKQRGLVSGGTTATVQRALGTLLIIGALLGAASGGAWREGISALLLAPAWSARLELWLPFWPFEPFLPLAVLGLGTWLLTAGREAPQAKPELTAGS